MTERSPPFTALRAVEAATRHRSFTGAARELQITHSAVSQSIRRLETELGATLFERKGGAMEPSIAALKLAETYSAAQDALVRAIREIADPEAISTLAVSMPPELARLWFSSKLSALGMALPDVEVEVRTRADDASSAVGLAWTELPDSQALYELTHVPVCHPDLLTTLGLETAQDVVRAPLIAEPGASWGEWAMHCLSPGRAPRAHVFDDPALAMEAAIHGSGVALTNLFVADRHLESGSLVALPFEAPSSRGLALRSAGAMGEAAERFVSWLKLEIRRGTARLKGGAARSL
ncbi:LysR family transcriptional regulator [Caulobacter sp. X]|uniref:LysR family transcriptional regulator n=1 Tax=Caulobacter sp. X TaxID=2048901 RepID=UPI000C14E035|nr:LysR family transcriptional regulator [Caulobacter sp. X]PIB96857.1 hypothetical protein CSW60_20440 [Caulobacter sp. X]